MSTVHVIPVNESFVRINAPRNVLYELRDRFQFEVPGAKFTPAYKKGHWDGMIRLFNTNTRTIYKGLLHEIKKFCKQNDFDFESDVALPLEDIDEKEVRDFVSGLNIPFELRDYQIDTICKGICHPRAAFLSSTSSGKGISLYCLARWYNKKTLIIVPTITLVHQLSGDFVDYGADPDSIHKIYSGQEKETDCQITISTWQSLKEMPEDFFDQFEVLMVDEVQSVKGKVLQQIITSMKDCAIRFGFTGSLDGTEAHELVVTGLFGPIHQIISAKELMDSGFGANIQLECIRLEHPYFARKYRKYHEEIEYINGCEARNNFIVNLASKLDGNTLILFYKIEHGKLIHRMLQEKFPDRNIHYISGETDGEFRNEIRSDVEDDKDAIIVASYGVLSVGYNVKRLHNIIFASAWKSRVSNLQSIGRGMRLGEGKTKCTIYDLTDDLSIKKRKNYTLTHQYQRIELYAKQDFDYRIMRFKLQYEPEPIKSKPKEEVLNFGD